MENIEDLRKTLFETIRDVKEGKMPLDRAKMVQELGQTLVNSAKAEVDYLKVTGRKGGTGFIPGLVVEGPKPAALPKGQGYEGKLNPERR
jgi:glutamate synthase domain-containing protein 2